MIRATRPDGSPIAVNESAIVAIMPIDYNGRAEIWLKNRENVPTLEDVVELSAQWEANAKAGICT